MENKVNMEQEVKQKVKEILRASNQKRRLEMELTKELLQLCKKELIGKKICIMPLYKYGDYLFIFIKDVKKSSWGCNNHIAIKGCTYEITAEGCIQYWNKLGKNLNHVCISEMKGFVEISDEQWEAIEKFARVDEEMDNERKQFLETLNR